MKKMMKKMKRAEEKKQQRLDDEAAPGKPTETIPKNSPEDAAKLEHRKENLTGDSPHGPGPQRRVPTVRAEEEDIKKLIKMKVREDSAELQPRAPAPREEKSHDRRPQRVGPREDSIFHDAYESYDRAKFLKVVESMESEDCLKNQAARYMIIDGERPLQTDSQRIRARMNSYVHEKGEVDSVRPRAPRATRTTM